MITQIKKWGDSKVIVFSAEFLKFHGLDVDDWIDISDIVKVKVEIWNEFLKTQEKMMLN